MGAKSAQFVILSGAKRPEDLLGFVRAKTAYVVSRFRFVPWIATMAVR
jgi:hypothetical protein